jgi:hypothetical protein
MLLAVHGAGTLIAPCGTPRNACAAAVVLEFREWNGSPFKHTPIEEKHEQR